MSIIHRTTLVPTKIELLENLVKRVETLVIGVLTVGSAIFASHNSRAMTACIASCE